jgi:hypothetical protein
MSLDKAIKSGKEWRKEKRRGCGYHCSWCLSNRVYANRKRLMKALYDQKAILQEAA